MMAAVRRMLSCRLQLCSDMLALVWLATHSLLCCVLPCCAVLCSGMLCTWLLQHMFGHAVAAAGASAAGPAGVALLQGLVLFGALLYVFGRGAKFSLFKPAEEMVYITLDEEGRTRGKAAIDVVGSQVGAGRGSYQGAPWGQCCLRLYLGIMLGEAVCTAWVSVIALAFTFDRSSRTACATCV